MYPEDEDLLMIAEEMNTDVELLRLVADRFSKIGTIPKLGPINIYDNLNKHLLYVQQRASRKITFDFPDPDAQAALMVNINPLLFDNKVHTGFDANGSFYEKDLDAFAYFANTYQTVIEQPFPPDRFDVLQKAKKRFPTLQICADEEVKHLGDVMKLHQLKAIDEVNLKIGRVGGITNSIEILNYCEAQGISCWIGGMFETGIGRLANLELASYLPNAKAHDLSPSARYFQEDMLSPEVTMNRGFVELKALETCVVVEELLEKGADKSLKNKKRLRLNLVT